MKHSRLRLLFLLLAAPLLASAQSAYKGQLHVTDERFSLQGQLLRVYMKVSYDDNALNTGETLLFTPVLKTGERYVRLSSVAINGDARERYEQRSARLQHRRRINIPVVTRDSYTRTRSFIYDTTIPYQSWMSGAALYAECEESTWQGRNPHVYEDLLLHRLPLGSTSNRHQAPLTGREQSDGTGRISASWVHFLAPAQAQEPGATVCGTLRLPYDRRLSRRNMSALADSLQEVIGRESSNYGNRLLRVELTGYGAPIGNRRKNEQLAADYTLRLRRVLSDRHVTGEHDLRVTWVSEDWDSIRHIVGTAPMALRAATEDIIRSIDVNQGREHALQTLGSGTAYAYLQRAVFPQVTRLHYVLHFTSHSAVYNADSRLNSDLPSAITPANFYAMAAAYEVGSQNFCDIIDLAARLFPDSPEACIDAAGVALMQGDAEKARRYLSPWDTDPRAWCNLGLLHLLEGNRDKAEVYLRMAEANGVVPAREALRHLLWE